MIDKSLKQHYEMQGKVKNYLGKQKMVKAPVKWKSGPDHPNTELAYITKAEKDALIKMNMYGSMNGKANKGPSGIISLNGWGDSGRGTSDASYGGGNVSGGGDNRDYGGGAAAEARSAAAAATQEAARVAAVQANEELTRQREMKELIAKQQEEKYDVPVDPNKFGETISPMDKVMSKDEKDYTIEDKRIIEEYEKTIDYDKVKELSDRGHSSEDIQKAIDKGLLMKQDSIRRQGLIERGLAAIKPTTKLESSLMGTLKKTFDPKRMATNFAMKKMGLSWLNPFLGIGSFLLDKFAPGKKEALTSRFSRNKPTDMSAFNQLGRYADRQPTSTNQFANRVGQTPNYTAQVAGKENVIAKGMEKYTGGISPELQKLMAKGKSYSETDIIPSKYQGANLAKFAGSEYDTTTSLEKTPELQKKMNDAVDKAVNDYLGKIQSGEISFPDNLQLEMDKVGNDARHNIMKSQSDSPNIFSETLQEGLDKSNIQEKQKRSREQELLKEIGLAHGGRIDKPFTGRSRDI